METSGDHSHEDAVFALFDGDFHLGLGALVNSLYSVGFRGHVYAGYRGALPQWADSRRDGADYHHYEVADGCAIRFAAVDFAGHLTNYKPAFMLSMLRAHGVGAKRLYYLDADIVVKAPWRFFQDWVSCGIAVCRDVNEPHMSANHPMRKYWRQFAAELGLECRPVEGYFNAGFLGLSAEHVGFLEMWESLMQHLARSGVSFAAVQGGGRANPILNLDQDMLNAALMATEFPIAPVENSNMDFSEGGYVMSHAISRAKPWRRRYIRDALLGYPPDTAHKLFWRHVSEPILVFPQYRTSIAKLSLSIAAAIGRFYGRR